jgi:hypothetical protein
MLVLASGLQTRAQEAPSLLGVWKVIDTMQTGQNIVLGIVHIQSNEGKPELTWVAHGHQVLENAAVENMRFGEDGVHFDLKTERITFRVAAYAPEGERRPKTLRGSVQIRSQRDPLTMEKTLKKEIAPADVASPNPDFEALRKVRDAGNGKEAEDILRGVLKEHAGKPVAYFAGQRLLKSLEEQDAKEDALREGVDLWVKSAGPFGRELEQHVRLEASRMLLLSENGTGVALAVAQDAIKNVKPDDPKGEQVAVFKLVRDALLANDPRNQQLKALNERIEKIETALDAEYEKTALPFEPEEVEPRNTPGKRVAVVELFTGAQCPPCVSADLAFDGLLKTYAPSDAIFLQYHLHIPAPDPLTNADAEKRSEFYGDDVGGTPSMFLNGKPTPPMGGFRQHGKERYEAMRELVDKALKAESRVEIKVDVSRKADRIDVVASVSEIEKPSPDLRLRLVLVEDVVRYPGNNGIRLHHHVVRSFPGGVDGLPVKNASAEQKARIDLLQLTKQLEDYLIESNKDNPFLDSERPLKLDHLKVVAFLQNDVTKEILQAVQVDVPKE